MINLELIDDFKQEEWDFNRVCMKDPDNKDVKIIVGYHGSCIDGISAAAIFKMFAPALLFKNEQITIVTIDIQYGDSYTKLIPVHPENCELFLLDFSFGVQDIKELCKVFKKVTIWDHHEAAEKKINTGLEEILLLKNFNSVFDMNRCGTSLTLFNLVHSNIIKNYEVNPNIEPELEEFLQVGKIAYNTLTHNTFSSIELENIWAFVKIVESGDLYTFKEPDSKEIGVYLKSYYKKISVNYAIEFISNLSLRDFHEMKMIGSSFLAKDQLEFHFMVKKIKRDIENNKMALTILNGIPTVCINYTGNVSDLGNFICRETNFPVCMYWFMEKVIDGVPYPSVIASMRSMDHLPSVCDITMFYGGGGHRNAAGFEIKGTVSDFDERFSKIFGSNANKVFLKDLEK